MWRIYDSALQGKVLIAPQMVYAFVCAAGDLEDHIDLVFEGDRETCKFKLTQMQIASTLFNGELITSCATAN